MTDEVSGIILVAVLASVFAGCGLLLPRLWRVSSGRPDPGDDA